MSHLKLVAAACTHPGRKKTENEDVFLVRDGLFVVCDGMGGSNAGGFASHWVAGALPDVLRTELERHPEDPIEAVRSALAHLSTRLWSMGVGSRAMFGTGTTLVLVLQHGDLHLVAHVGDSRAYRLRETVLSALTQDHVKLLPRQDGTLRTSMLQYIGLRYMRCDVAPLALQDGDRIVLCTDGLHRELADEVTRDILLASSSPQAACQALVDAANENGGHDNITALVIDCLEATPTLQ